MNDDEDKRIPLREIGSAILFVFFLFTVGAASVEAYKGQCRAGKSVPLAIVDGVLWPAVAAVRAAVWSMNPTDAAKPLLCVEEKK